MDLGMRIDQELVLYIVAAITSHRVIGSQCDIIFRDTCQIVI